MTDLCFGYVWAVTEWASGFEDLHTSLKTSPLICSFASLVSSLGLQMEVPVGKTLNDFWSPSWAWSRSPSRSWACVYGLGGWNHGFSQSGLLHSKSTLQLESQQTCLLQ